MVRRSQSESKQRQLERLRQAIKQNRTVPVSRWKAQFSFCISFFFGTIPRFVGSVLGGTVVIFGLNDYFFQTIPEIKMNSPTSVSYVIPFTIRNTSSIFPMYITAIKCAITRGMTEFIYLGPQSLPVNTGLGTVEVKIDVPEEIPRRGGILNFPCDFSELYKIPGAPQPSITGRSETMEMTVEYHTVTGITRTYKAPPFTLKEGKNGFTQMEGRIIE